MRCLAFHPTKPVLAVAVGTCIGGYDLLTGCRLGRVDARAPAVGMVFSRDGALLAAATQEWHIIGVNAATWRGRVLAPYREPRSAPLEGIMMAVTPGARPAVFFTRHGKDSVRMVVPGMEGRKAAEKLKWGLKLRLDVRKPVIGLAAHASEQALMVLFGDGALRGYAMGSAGLVPTFALAVDALAGGRVSLAASLLEARPHPFVAGAGLLLYGTQSGGVLAFELPPGGREEPRLLLRARAPGGRPVVGLGVHEATNTLLAFSAAADGGVRAQGWRMYPMGGSGGGGAAASAAAAGDAAAASAGRAREGRIALAPVDVDVPALAPSLTGAIADNGEAPGAPPRAALGGGSGGGALDTWDAVWGATSAAAHADDGGANFLLGRVLAPSAAAAAVHPTLGVVAVQLVPPLALRQAPKIMAQPLGLISPAEAGITRRTASVPLLRVLDDAAPLAGWPGGAAAPMHTAIDFFQAASGCVRFSLARASLSLCRCASAVFLPPALPPPPKCLALSLTSPLTTFPFPLCHYNTPPPPQPRHGPPAVPLPRLLPRPRRRLQVRPRVQGERRVRGAACGRPRGAAARAALPRALAEAARVARVLREHRAAAGRGGGGAGQARGQARQRRRRR